MSAPGAIAPPWISRVLGAGGGWEAGNALTFDGTNDLVSLLTDITLTGDFTLSVWLNMATFGDAVVGNADDNQSFLLNSGNITTMGLTIAGANDNFTWAEDAKPLDTWVHLLLVRGATSLQGRMWIDGVAAENNPRTISGNDWVLNEIGAIVSAVTYNGIMDDLYIWDGVIGDGDDATALYNLGVPVDPESVILDATYKYRFNQSEGTNLPDLGASENNGTLVNFADPDSNWVSRL